MLKANSYGNLVSLLFVVMLTMTAMLAIDYAGSLGLAYVGLGLAIYLPIAGVSRVMGGIAANAFRLTKMVKMHFKPQAQDETALDPLSNVQGQNNAFEIDSGARSVAMVGRILNFFCAVYMCVMFLGYYCQEFRIVQISLFDMQFLVPFIFGGAFPFMISHIFLENIEDNTHEMVRRFL